MYCYQCDKEVNYLFDDGRGKCCTRLTKEEITGEKAMSEPLTTEKIKEVLTKVIAEQHGITEGEINWDGTFYENGFDSLDFVELMMGIEAEIGVSMRRNIGEMHKLGVIMRDMPVVIQEELYPHV